MTLPAILGSALLILLSLFILLALLLLVPVDLEGRVARGGSDPQTRMRIGWLFGHLHKDVSRGSDERKPSMEGEEGAQKKEDDEVREEKGGVEKGEDEVKKPKVGLSSSKVALELLRTEGFLRNLARLLRGLFGTVRVSFLKIEIKVGLEDPADTAEAAGLLWAVLIPLESLTPIRSRIEPSFSEEALEGSFEGRLRIVPIRVIPPLALFLLSPPTWRAGFRAIRAGRGKR
jgi:hypothetical protein